MTDEQDLAELARSIVDSNRYMTLGTADAAGLPWGSESAGDLRILTATGATARIRRTLTAATAGALALLGALLGVVGAYAYQDDLGYLSDVPLLYLVILVAGVPLIAAAAGWLVAGREPPALARPVIE
jgi:putative ABC transport system permease protein